MWVMLDQRQYYFTFETKAPTRIKIYHMANAVQKLCDSTPLNGSAAQKLRFGPYGCIMNVEWLKALDINHSTYRNDANILSKSSGLKHVIVKFGRVNTVKQSIVNTRKYYNTSSITRFYGIGFIGV